MTTHTPLPWMVCPGKLPDSGRGLFRIRADDGSAEPVVAICFPSSDGEIYEDDAKANAEFIVRATANFAPMLAALKLAMDDGFLAGDALDAVSAAIAAAEA